MISSFIHGGHFYACTSMDCSYLYSSVCRWCVCVCVSGYVCTPCLPMEASIFGESNISRLHWFWNKPLRSCVSSVLLPSLSGLSTHSSFPSSRVASLSCVQHAQVAIALCIRFLSCLSLMILWELRLGDKKKIIKISSILTIAYHSAILGLSLVVLSHSWHSTLKMSK